MNTEISKQILRGNFCFNKIFHFFPGLAPSTQYRVTVRAKHLRAVGQQNQPQQHPGPAPEEAPGAYTDFRTLAKGLPDPPQVMNFPNTTGTESY